MSSSRPSQFWAITSLVRFSNTIEEEVYSKLGDLVSLNVEVIQGELDAAHLIGSLLSQNNELVNFVTGDKTLKESVYKSLVDNQANQSEIIEMIIITDSKSVSLTASNDKNASIDVSDRA